MSRLLAPILVLVAFALSACAPLQQGALRYSVEPTTGFADNWFTSYDGAKLGLDTWTPSCRQRLSDTDDVVLVVCPRPEHEIVIIALHGMNDYAAAFNAAGAWWASQGATVYAYDQRGHGRSPQPGIWPKHEVLRADLKTAVKVARQRHPNAKIAVVGESMGASVAITAFADPDPPAADALILSGPGLRGWGTLPWLYSASLWTSSHVRPAWVVIPPKGVRIVATDNNAKLREMWNDPLVLKNNRIDSVYGVVSIMEEADAKIGKLPKSVPTLLLYGAKDEMIPVDGVKRATAKMPGFVKTAYYKNGFHMLMNDLQAQTVWSDILAFVDHPDAPVASGSPPLPWLTPKTPANDRKTLAAR